MTTGTRFWVVRPRVGASGVSGLGTLLSGAYIGFDPGQGERTSTFTGLEEPPPIAFDVPGKRFLLHADSLGSADRGSPVYYHGLRVGQVLGYALDDDRRTFTLEIFVDAPHDALVRDTSRFWNASGFDISVGTGGIEVASESLQTIIAGGVAFDTPDVEGPGEPSATGHGFRLFESRRKVDEPVFTQKVPYPRPLHRLGQRPARRQPGRVQRHPGRHRDRRPARVRWRAEEHRHSGDARDRAPADSAEGRAAEPALRSA